MEFLILGGLNDGIEPAYPGSDVEALSLYSQVICRVEGSDPMIDHLPDWHCFQGEGNSLDTSMAFKPGLPWDFKGGDWPYMTAKRNALCVRVDFRGSPLSIIVTHRPTKEHSDKWPEFNANLGALAKRERDAGRIALIELDANAANPNDLEIATRAIWTPAFPMSIDGWLVTWRAKVQTIFKLPKTGEHYPNVLVVKTPDLL